MDDDDYALAIIAGAVVVFLLYGTSTAKTSIRSGGQSGGQSGGKSGGQSGGGKNVSGNPELQPAPGLNQSLSSAAPAILTSVNGVPVNDVANMNNSPQAGQ